MTLLQANIQVDSEVSSSTLHEEPQAWRRTLSNQFQAIKDDIDPYKLTLAELVNRFKSMLPSRKAEKAARAAYTTFQEQSHDLAKKSDKSGDLDSLKDLKQSQDQRKKPNFCKKDRQSGKTDPSCVCGANHPIYRCYYLVSMIAPKGWSPKEEITTKIISNISRN
jgi:hypothetical protein